ncbi:MAG: glycosyltransferase family 4 protein [Candidatus Asgardarchaeia archaeon]
MRVLHVTPFFAEGYGGTERYSYFLTKYLAKNGVNVTVFTSHMLRESQRDYYARNNLRVRRFLTIGNMWGINPIAFMFPSLLADLDDFDVVHVHSYLYFTSNQVALAKIYRSFVNTDNPPIVLQIHGGIGIPKFVKVTPYKRFGKRFYDLIFGRLTLMASDFIATMSELEWELLRKYFGLNYDNHVVLPNAIEDKVLDNAKFIECDKNKDPFTIIYVGDVEPWKGVENLLIMTKLLYKKIKNLRVIIVGEGTQKKYLEQVAAKNKLPMLFAGYLPHSNALNEITHANVFVLPSLWEGMPTVLLEAMGLKTPVVTTNVGAVPEMVKDGETGLVVPPNDPQALTKAILKYWEDQDFAREIAENAFRTVKKYFTFSNVAKKAIRLYNLAIELSQNKKKIFPQFIPRDLIEHILGRPYQRPL